MNIPFLVTTSTALAAELRRVRHSRKMTQKSLAAAAGLDLATVAKLEAGRGTVASLVTVMHAVEHRFLFQVPGEALGRGLARKRREMNLSQQSLCGLAGLSKPSIIQVERDQGHVTSLMTVMQVLRLPLSLVPNEQERSSPSLVRIHEGDCREILPHLPSHRFHTCITSPPYFQQRDYGVTGQIGLEASEAEYVVRIVEVMRQVRRVMREDGTLWLVIGDAFARRGSGPRRRKELLGLPWRVAFALQEDGWLLRQDIILNKANPLPEPVTDRFARAHEYLFLLTKRQRYRLDVAAVRERGVTTQAGAAQRDTRETHGAVSGGNTGLNAAKERLRREIEETGFSTRHKRSVWPVVTQSSRHGHFAAFPKALVETCIRAGCPEGGAVLDPFAGSGTTGVVARRLNRGADLIELNPAYAALIRRRCA